MAGDAITDLMDMSLSKLLWSTMDRVSKVPQPVGSQTVGHD